MFSCIKIVVFKSNINEAVVEPALKFKQKRCRAIGGLGAV